MKGRPSEYTDEQYQECFEAYDRGESLLDAAKTHGMAAQTLATWMIHQGKPRRRAGRKRLRPIKPTRAPVHVVNLHELTEGACMRLKGLCEFDSCRYRCNGGGCALKISDNGEHSLEDVSSLVGITRQGADLIVRRAAKKLLVALEGWR